MINEKTLEKSNVMFIIVDSDFLNSLVKEIDDTIYQYNRYNHPDYNAYT